MVKMQKTKQGTYHITIPKERIERLGIKQGDKFDVDFTHDNNIILTRIRELRNAI